MSIRAKLSLAFLALGAAAAGVGLETARVRARRAVREDAISQFAQVEGRWHAALLARLNDLSQDVAELAKDVNYVSCMDKASANPSDFAATPGDLAGSNACLTALALHTRWGPTFVLLNDEGKQIIRQGDVEDDIGRSFADRTFVQDALHGRTAFERDRGFLDVATPFTNVEGKLLGVALAGIDLASAFASLGRELGVAIALDPGGFPGPPEELREAGRDLLVQDVSLLDPDGRALATVSLRRDLGNVLAPFDRALGDGAIFGAAAALLLALALGLVLAGRVTRPLLDLARASAAIAQGRYDTRVAVRSKDEIGRLAQRFNAMAEGLGQRVFFESALRRYLASAVVDELIRDPGRMRLGGERREMTVLFFDVAGFTTLSESLAPDELVALCNGYLERVVAALFDAGGTLDKFIGDAVMALFGVPLAQDDHPARACRAAVAMQGALRDYAAASPNPKVKTLHARVGLHTGAAAFGNLGARSIMSLTAMGDAVNLASRLEGVNKVYGTAILASEATVSAAGCPARELDSVRVVGRHEPVRIYEILGETPPPPAALEAYAQGLAAYRARRFAEAAAAFEAAADAPGRTMAARCRGLENAPPAPDWDGSFTLDHK